MRIGKITLNGQGNYGNKLQNYALQYVLLKYADEVDTLWHTGENYLPKSWKYGWKEAIKFFVNRHGFRNEMKGKYFPYEIVRQHNIKLFDEKYIFTKYDCKDLKMADATYDYFVVGSDQVWNPYSRCTDAEFLTFTDKKKRIAYAASIGISEIPTHLQEQFKKWFEGMEHISVREQAGAEIIYKLTKREVPVLVDPTVLLSKEEWLAIAKKPNWFIDEPYILTYFLGNMSLEIKQMIEKIAKEKGWKIINLLDLSDFDGYTIGPDEFIYLINHCSLLYTDSFHGCVFSILQQVPFVACDRVQKGWVSMSSRLDTLLKLFGLENRKGTAANRYCRDDLLNIEYAATEQILAVERKRAEVYLKNALK